MFDGCAVSPVVRRGAANPGPSADALLLAQAVDRPPGAEAIGLLAQVRVDALDDHERVDLLDAWERCSRWVAAQQTKAVVGVAGEHMTDRDDAAREFVRAALREVGGSSKAHVDLSRALAGPLRAARDAMEAGDLSYEHAKALAWETEHLDPVTRAQVAAEVVAEADGRTPAQLRQRARRAAIKADPALADRMARETGRRRMVARRNEPDSQASMFLTGPALDIQTVWTALDVLAARTGAEDTRTLDQRRFDSLVGLAAGALVDAGRGSATRCGISPNVYVFADAATWAGLADEPVELDGYGPIPAGIARDYLGSATWRAVVTDALSGQVLAVSSSSYSPTVRTRRQLHVQDRRCIFPGCSTAVWFCDADHGLPYDQGGCTDGANCGLLCRRHHRLKTFYDWRWERESAHSITWTAPTGHTYRHQLVRYLMPPRGDPSADDEIPPF